MKKLIAKIRAILRNRRVRKIWTRTVSSIACLVVFITTYALVLPAITMESEAACGIEAHQHDESCYEERLICNIPESDGHMHTEDCYSTTQKLICGLSEHLHTSDCYDEEGNLTCSQEEHQHGKECYEEIRELICGLEESEGHHHDSSCYEKVLTCEKEVHTHSPACYREDAASVAATEHAAIAATTTTSAEDAAIDETANASGTFDPAETAAEGYVPTLDELDFRQLLNDYTTIYYHRPEDSTEDSGQITDWQKVTEDTVLGETDILRVYLAYTIPAGSLNETNATARYRLPGNLHLTDEQMEAINQMENGLSGLYVDYDTLQITDTEKHSAYLGAEAVDGLRTPGQKIEDYLSDNNNAGDGKQTAQEIISAVVKSDQVYDEDGVYGKKGAYLGTDLVFTFSPYTILKNRNEYDSEGTPVKAGESVSGWFTLDFNMDQVDWDGNTAEITFVSEDNDLNTSLVSMALKKADLTSEETPQETDPSSEESSDSNNSDDEKTFDDNSSTEENKAETVEETHPAVNFEDSLTVHTGNLSSDTDAGNLPNSSKMAVSVSAEAGTFPAGTTMVLSAVTDMDAVAEAVEGTVDSKTCGFQAVDISFQDKDGNEIEPLKPISVTMRSNSIKAATEDSSMAPVVVHVEDQSKKTNDAASDLVTTVMETIPSSVDNNDASESHGITDSSESISFKADSFSIYAIVYTVDFHYEINGKMYDFSIPGGGFVSLEHVVEVLGIASSDENSENGAENAENGAENEDDFVGEVPGVDVSVGNDTAYEEAIKLNELEVSEATKKFVADVESVEFSSPELVWVGKVDDEVTVGGLKEANRLEVEYSAELTEEQIAEINGQSVEAGDWALISVQPFMSEETLTVTMKNGEVFTIHVTDDNDPLGLNGRTYALLAFNGVHALIRNNNAIGSLGINKSVGTDYAFSGGKDYIRQDATAWEFKYNFEKQAYQISNNGQYLSINTNTTSGAPTLVTDATAASTWIKITRDESGNYYLGNEKGAFIYDNNGTFALTTNSSDNRTAFHMCLPENPDGSHKATLTAAKDLSVGQTIVIYQKVWNSQTDEYDYYAIDGHGQLQKVWDSSDSLYWKEDISIEWELREETDSDRIPTGYLQLYNKKTGTYLAPKSSRTGFAATHAASSITAEDMKEVRVSLPGRDAGEYSSRIATWDYDDNTTYGLDVNYDPANTAEPYTLTVKELLQSGEFLFAVRDPLVQKQLTTVDTVDSASKGIKMTMYDFDGAKRGTQELYYMTDVIGEYFYSNGYTFTDSTKAGKQHPTLVTRVLGEDGFPVSAINNKSLGMIFYPPAGASSHGTSYTVARTDDVNHLFLQSVYDSTGFYYYSCFDNYARLKTGSKDFEVYEQVGSPRDASQFFFNRGNFMPYNDLDLTTVKKNLYVGDQNNTQYDDAYPRKQEDLYIIKGGQNGADYFFGMTMEAKFQQGANGVSENGDPIVYDFNGDDDLWIYVDDVLLMDIGGVHDAIHGTINFSTGKITVYNTDNNGTEHPSTTYIKDQFWQAHRFPDGSLWTEEMGPDHPKANEFFTDGGKTSDGKLIGTFKDYSTHDFKMFYMERGGGASNLQINFNLPVITRDEFRVTKKMLTTATGQPIQSAYADAAFYYKAYIKQGDNWVEYKKSDYPSGTTAVYDDEKRTPVVWKEIIDSDTGEVTGYSDTIFEVKPGQTAVIPVADSQVEYKVVEIEPELGLSHMLDNFNVSNSDQDPNDSKSTVGKTVKRRGQVFFDNKPIDEIVNELRITKNLHGDLYRNSSTKSGYVEDQNGSPYFEYRIFLEATSGQLVPYSLGEYYQIDGSEEHKGQYVYYDKGERLYATVNSSGQYVYTYPNSGKPTDTLSEPKITEHTSQNGSLGDVRPGDTIIVKGLLEGTDFVVDERLDRTHMRQKDAATDDGWEADWENKYYFSHTDVDGAMERGTDGTPTADTRPDNYEIFGTLFDKPINDGELSVSGNEARGTIVANKDAEVVVHNEVYNQFELPIEKKWSSDFNMSSLDNAEVTFTLKRMKLEDRKGAFTLMAMPSGVPEGFDPEYIFTKSTGEIFTVKLSEMYGSNDTYTKSFSLPIGTYSVSYGDAPAGYDVAYSPESASVTVSSDNSENGAAASPSVITLADTYTRQTGSIQVTKNLKGYHGNNSFENFTATYTVTDTAGRAVQDANNQEVQSVTLHYSDFISGKAEINFNNLPAGQYLVRETIASSSYNNDKYTVVNTADPESGIVTVTRGNPATMTCTSTYTEVKSNPIQIIVKETEYGRNNTLYSNNSSFRPGDQVIITFVHQNNNNALKYRVNNGEWITVSTTGNGGSVTDEIRMTVPDNGITVEFKDGWSQMKADNINVIKDQGVVANRISAMGTSNTASARMMMRAPRLAAGSSTNNTPSASNDAPLPSVQDTQMFSPDSWQLIVTMKNGGDLLDSDGHKIGSFTGNGNNTWSVTLKGAGFDGLTGTDEDGNLYYYYIDAITEKNVPDGTTPSIATEENGDRYLYSRTDQATNTGRVLRAENELITKVSIGIQKTDDHGNPIEEAVFKLVNGSEIVSISASGDGVIVHAVNTNESVTIKDNTFTVPKGGVIIDGIPSSNNKYKIVEVSSPPGFIINDNEPVEFEVKAGRLTETHKTGVSFSSTGNVFTIPNTPGAALPNTGGPGTRIFTILGSILILGAGELLWRRRKLI